MFDISKYQEAKTLTEALDYIKQNDDAKIVAGGTDVLIRIREGKLAGAHLLGISYIAELKHLYTDDNGDLHMGPMVTFTDIEESDVIKSTIPYYAGAVGAIGGPQIRNVATLGGNICNGATSADSATTLFCLNATLTLQTADETREIPIAEFYLGPGKVDLKPGEMLTDITVKKAEYEGYVGRYMKFAQRNAMDIATLGCAVVLKQNGDTIEDIRIACGVAAPTPVRCFDAENWMKGKAATMENIDEMAKMTLSNTKPRDSWRGSKEFRENLIYMLAKRGTMMLVGLDNE